MGPPGVGKTLIAKVWWRGSSSIFLSEWSKYVEIYVGMGAKKIHQLFQSAKRRAPSIIFIDEIGCSWKKVEGKKWFKGNDEEKKGDSLTKFLYLRMGLGFLIRQTSWGGLFG